MASRSQFQDRWPFNMNFKPWLARVDDSNFIFFNKIEIVKNIISECASIQGSCHYFEPDEDMLQYIE